MEEALDDPNPYAYEPASRLSRSLRDMARKHGRHDLVQVVNTGDFVLACVTDMEIMIDHLCASPPPARASLYARVACLTMAEFLDDVPSLTGRAFQDIVRATTGEEGLREFRSIRKELSGIRKTHEEDVREVRNVAIAHREHDIEAQSDIIQAIDYGGVVVLATALLEWHASFTRFQARIYKCIAEELRGERSQNKGIQPTA